MAETFQESIDWSWADRRVHTGASHSGSGPRALLLSALSSISTRTEMEPLQRYLADRFETLTLDWPGFGTVDKPFLDWTPDAMAAYLAHVFRAVMPEPALIVAAGYVLRHFSGWTGAIPALVLVAPTWRGPFPTMLGRRPGWLARLRAAMDAPVAGPALYATNLSDPVVRRMARGHVYSDPDFLTPARMTQKRAVTRSPGARFASVRFVTGALDPFATEEEVLSAASVLSHEQDILIWGAEAPPKSRAAMEALARAAGITPHVLPRGKLNLHEEFPAEVAEAIRTFGNEEGHR